MIGFSIRDAFTKVALKITSNGEVISRPQFSLAEKRTIDDSAAVNFVNPRVGFKTIITGLIINGSRSIGADGSLVELYETTSETSTVVSKDILSFDIIKNGTVVTAPILIETTGGTFINAKASDFDINITLLCYFSAI